MKKLFALGCLALSALGTGVQAADFPIKDKPVTIVVPFSAGGPTDRVARDLAEALRKPLGSNVVVENVAGAGGTIGANKVAKAAPDGHTVLLHHIGMATSPALYRKMPYNTLEDFEYLGMVNDVPMTLIGRPTLPANNYKELASWIAQNKGSVNLGNAGLGAASHLCGLLFQSALKIDMTTVPYKGTAPAMNDLMGGQIDLLCDQTTNTTQHIKAGTVKNYGVTTLGRIGALPDSSLRARRLRGVKSYVLASPDYLAENGEPRHPAQLGEHRCLSYSLSSNPESWRFTGPDGSEAVVRLSGPLRVNNGEAMLPALCAGLGIGTLPDFICEKEIAAGRLIPILSEWKTPPIAIHIVTPPGSFRPRRLTALIEFLAEKLSTA